MKKIILTILDGFGLQHSTEGNAIYLANPEFLNFAVSEYPAFPISAAGPFAGLPWGEPGNSEVGHTALGTGRIVEQYLSIISRTIQNGSFFKHKVLLQAIDYVKKNNSSFHIAGMISQGGIHSYDEHALALVELAKRNGIKKVFIHMFADGEDMPKDSGLKTIEKVEERLKEIGVGAVSTIIGRKIAMDRIEDWDKTETTFKAMVYGEGERYKSAKKIFEENYHKGIYDHDIPPSIVSGEHMAGQFLSDNDVLIFTNYRPERIAQIAQFFDESILKKIRPDLVLPKNLFVATMTEYNRSLKFPILFGGVDVKNTLGEVLNNNNISQLRIAEKEKFAHITIFFNASLIQYKNEERIAVVSEKKNGKDYLDNPEMSAAKIAQTVLDKFDDYDVIVVNFANTDMLGHSGNLNAAKKAVQEMDKNLRKIYDKVIKSDCVWIITADHGNAEEMINLKSHEEDTKHSVNPIPLIFISKNLKNQDKIAGLMDLATKNPIGTLSDIAPTILEILGVEKPEEMTGVSLYNIVYNK